MKNISVMDKYDTSPILYKHYTEDISIDDTVNITREFKKLWNDFCTALDNGEVSQVESYAIRLLFGAARPEIRIYFFLDWKKFSRMINQKMLMNIFSHCIMNIIAHWH